MDWHDLFAAIALMLVLEGVMPFVNPAGTRRTMARMSELREGQLRFAGLGAMLAGLALLYFVRF